MRSIIAFIVVGFGCAAGLAAREWSDSTGKFKIEAEFVSLEDGKVLLKKPDGGQVTIPLEKLSAADQKVATKMASEPANPFEEAPAADPKAVAGTGKKGAFVTIPPLDGAPPVKSGEVRKFAKGGWGVHSLAFAPDGGTLAVGKNDRALQLLDVVETSVLDFHEKLEHLDQVGPCIFTPDGTKLLTGGRSGEIVVWDVSADHRLKETAKFVGHSKETTAVAVSPDGKYCLSGGADEKVCYWRIEDGEELASFEGYEGKIKAVHVAKDGRGYGTDGAMLVCYNLRTKKEEGGRGKLCDSWASGQFAAFSPNGQYVAAGDGYTVRLWNVKTKRELGVLKDNEIQWSGAFTPDSDRLVTGGGGRVNVWNVERGKKIASLTTEGSYYVQCLAVSPDDLHVAAIPGSAGQSLQVFRIPKN